VFPPSVVTTLVLLLFIANTINLGAELAAMGAAVRLMLGWGSPHVYTLGFAVFSLLAVVFIPYHRYVGLLKWFTFSLLAYVGVVFTVKIDWQAVAVGALVPKFELSGEALTLVVAIFGTTISPYLFFWQCSQEVEDEEADPEAGPLIDRPEQADRELNRIGWETWAGMAVSNLIAFFIILTTAVTLHAAGKTDIQSAEQAAEALRPIAGNAAFVLFSLGLIGTGLLAVPVLAGSVAYAVGEARGWRTGLERPLDEARPFYLVIALAIVVGIAVDFLGLDPIKALVWSAVVNGVIVVPIMAAMMVVASRPKLMGKFVAARWQCVLGWAATAIMAAAAVAMFFLM
jgi:Mn2+/Fe2+ NRAMP family transporter